MLNLECRYLFIDEAQIFKCSVKTYKTDANNTYLDRNDLKLHKVYEFISLEETHEHIILISSGAFIPCAYFDNYLFEFKCGILEENTAIVIRTIDRSFKYIDTESECFFNIRCLLWDALLSSAS